MIAVAACGTATAPGGGGEPTGQAKPRVSLTFRLANFPANHPAHWTLRCDPPGGSHPDPAAVCAPLLRMKNPFAPLPKRTVCPMIMVSSRAILVTGTWFGSPVHRSIIDGGCDLGLFEKLTALLG